MSPLHSIGDFLRDLLLMIPLGVVRVLFLLLPVFLFWWVWRLPQAEVEPSGRPVRRGENLKVWALVALAIQILIYAWF